MSKLNKYALYFPYTYIVHKQAELHTATIRIVSNTALEPATKRKVLPDMQEV